MLWCTRECEEIECDLNLFHLFLCMKLRVNVSMLSLLFPIGMNYDPENLIWDAFQNYKYDGNKKNQKLK